MLCVRQFFFQISYQLIFFATDKYLLQKGSFFCKKGNEGWNHRVVVLLWFKYQVDTINSLAYVMFCTFLFLYASIAKRKRFLQKLQRWMAAPRNCPPMVQISHRSDQSLSLCYM
jgi:hypothetical protein